jgi:hypothetical protein
VHCRLDVSWSNITEFNPSPDPVRIEWNDWVLDQKAPCFPRRNFLLVSYKYSPFRSTSLCPSMFAATLLRLALIPCALNTTTGTTRITSPSASPHTIYITIYIIVRNCLGKIVVERIQDTGFGAVVFFWFFFLVFFWLEGVVGIHLSCLYSVGQA